jgi:anaerobic dimethyl sulfoxide reductase subunit A
MDAMAYVIWSEDLYDHFFVEERCLGFEKYFAYLNGEEDGVRKTPAWAAEITGIPEECIVRLARDYAKTKPAALMQGYGGQRHANGEQFTRGGIALACLTGNVGIPGGWASGAGQCKIVEMPEMPEVENPVKEQISVFTWTDAILEGRIKMILNLAGNVLINQHSDINRTKQILEDESKCEFIVCSDLFLTPSANYADLVLPATSLLESDNLITPWNQGNFLGFSNQVVDPVGESRFEFDWLQEVAEKLGVWESFTCGHKEYRDWLREIYEDYRTEEMPSYETLKEEGIYIFKDAPKVIAFEEQRRGEKPFETPSGKVEIYSPTLEAMNDTRIPPVPGYVEVKEGPGKSEKYPLQLIGWHTKGRAHSVGFNNEKLRERYPQILWMNPKDGAKRGLQTEDLAEIWNDRGVMIAPVFLTDEIIEGVVAIAEGAWHKADEKGRDIAGSMNVLTSQEPTPLAKGNPQHTNLVQVRKLENIE